MYIYNKVPSSGDPSNMMQVFEPLNIKILCCRYWVLEKWNSRKMAFPYWKLYWNFTEGAWVEAEKKIYLSPDDILLIPPFTSFSTGIDGRPDPGYSGHDLVGNPIQNKSQEDNFYNKNKILHLYIHFTLDNLLFTTFKKISHLKIISEQKHLIRSIIDKLMIENVGFDFHSSFEIYQLILSSLSKIKKEDMVFQKMDPRLLKVLEYIKNNLSNDVSNTQLAQEINMARNSFCRLFRRDLNCSPQEYVRNARINKAMELMDHSDQTMEEISGLCGFSDRFHLSKVFLQVKGIPPVRYRKRYSLNTSGVLREK